MKYVRIKTICLIVVVLISVNALPQSIQDSLFRRQDSLLQQKNSANNKHSNTIIIATGYAAVTLLTYKYMDHEMMEITVANQSKAASSISKTIGHAGLGTSNIAITAATGIVSVFTKNKKLQKAAILLAGGHIINDLVTNEIKTTFQRHRPNTGDPVNDFDWRDGPKNNTSFISSHTSNAFATATAFAIVYKDSKWVPPVAFTVASLVGLSRIYDNAHWTSDVLAGAAVGFASVKAMNEIYKVAERNLSFVPQVTNGHYSVTMLYCITGNRHRLTNNL